MAARAVLFVIFALSVTNSAWAQLPLRGHAFQRDGLFHTQRVRWGGGLTPQGAAFLTHAVDVFGPIVTTLATGRDLDTAQTSRDLDNDNLSNQRSRDFRSSAVWQDYLVEQRSANDLLRRTANLVGGSTGTLPPPVSPVGPNSADLEPTGSSDPWNKP